MLQGLLADHSRLHVLAALRSATLRFNELERRTGLSPPQVDRALKRLREGNLVLARALPPEGSRRPVAYTLSPKGRRAIRVLVDLERSVETHLGQAAANEIREVFAAHT
jgi:DNA-binding HxlR family transcriptional regulator